MQTVLFICSGNTCRSPMAAAIFNDLCAKQGLDFFAKSAGVATVSGLPASKNSLSVMKEIGIDLSEHKSKFLPELDIFSFDFYGVMNYNQAEILRSMGVEGQKITVLQSDKQLSKYDFEMGIKDPYGGDEAIYRQCRDELFVAVKSFIDKIK